MENRKTRERIVAENVKREHDHGLRMWVRLRPRTSNIFIASGSEATSTCSDVLRRMPGTVEALGRKDADAIGLSAFLRSRVSECLLRSYLAEVKLFLFSSVLRSGVAGSVTTVSAGSSSSAEPEDLLRIELSHRGYLVGWRGGEVNDRYNEVLRIRKAGLFLFCFFVFGFWPSGKGG